MAGAVALLSTVGTAVGASGATAAATGASVLGTAATTIGSVAAFSMKASALKQAAAVEEANAKLARERGQTSAQDADFELASLLSQDVAQQASSGLHVNSGSFVQTRQRRNVIGRTNRQRIVHDAEIQAISSENRAAAQRSSAKGAFFQSVFAVASGGIDLGGDLLDAANSNTQNTIAGTTRRRIAI